MNSRYENERSEHRPLLAAAGFLVVGAMVLLVLGTLRSGDEPARTTPEIPPWPQTAEERIRVAPDASGSEEKPEASEARSAGWAAWKRGDWTEAVRHFTLAAAREPGHVETEYMLGLTLARTGDLEGALQALERSVAANPDFGRAWINLSRIRNSRGEPAEALEAAEHAMSLDPNDAVALYQKARSLRNLGRIADAEAALAACLTLDPDHAHAHNLLGLMHLDAGRPGAASEEFAVAARLEPALAYIERNRALALRRDGRDEEAQVALRRAAEIQAGRSTAPAVAELAPAVVNPLEDSSTASAGPQTAPVVE